MVTGNKEKGCWIQCTQCGEVYYIEREVPIDRLYVASYCPGCGHTKGLNCGDKEEDVYTYYDPCLDGRYYTYY